jgi:hypothetical protein
MLTIDSTALPPVPQSVAAARDVVDRVTAHLPKHAREAAALVATELALNCVIHARTPFEVFAAADDDGTVEVIVADEAAWVKPPPAARGNGLLLVGLLSTAWSAEPEPCGKRVWVRLQAEDVPTV